MLVQRRQLVAVSDHFLVVVVCCRRLPPLEQGHRQIDRGARHATGQGHVLADVDGALVNTDRHRCDVIFARPACTCFANNKCNHV